MLIIFVDNRKEATLDYIHERKFESTSSNWWYWVCCQNARSSKDVGDTQFLILLWSKAGTFCATLSKKWEMLNARKNRQFYWENH